MLLHGYVRIRYTTNPGDLPEKAKWKQCDRDGATAWTKRVGPACMTVTARICKSVRFDEQRLGSPLAVQRLSKVCTAARLETACRIAMETTYSTRYRHIKPILDGKPGQTQREPRSRDHATRGVRARRRLLRQRGGDEPQQADPTQTTSLGADGLLDAFERQNEWALRRHARKRTRHAGGRRRLLAMDGRATGMIKRVKPHYPYANLRTLDSVDECGLDRDTINQLQSCAFIAQRSDILPVGTAGSGKSWFACAITKQACRQSYWFLYTRMPDRPRRRTRHRSGQTGRHPQAHPKIQHVRGASDERMTPRQPGDRIRTFSYSRHRDNATTITAPCSVPNSPSRTGTTNREAARRPTRSWTASPTTASPSTPMNTACANSTYTKPTTNNTQPAVPPTKRPAAPNRNTTGPIDKNN